MKKEFDEELKETKQIYKIAVPIIILILLAGILYAIFGGEKEPVPAPQPTIAPAPETPEPTPAPIPENVTNETIQTNITANETIQQPNVTIQIVANETINQTVKPAPLNVSWETINITFPDTLKRIEVGLRSHHYIEILEADGTPLTNSEQFELKFIIDDHKGHKSELVPSFEKQKWLISPLLANKGIYTLIVTITCDGERGYCYRIYGISEKTATTDLEVV